MGLGLLLKGGGNRVELCGYGLEVENKALVRGSGLDAQHVAKTRLCLGEHILAFVLAMEKGE